MKPPSKSQRKLLARNTIWDPETLTIDFTAIYDPTTNAEEMLKLLIQNGLMEPQPVELDGIFSP